MKRRKGEGRLRYRPDGRWECDFILGYDLGGKAIRKSVYASTSEEAYAKAQQAMEDFKAAQIANPASPEGLSLDVGGAAQAWLALVKPSVSERTYDRYVLDAGYAVQLAGQCRLSQLVAGHITGAIASSSLTPYQQHKGCKALRRVLAWAVKQGWIARNVAEDVPLPRFEKDEIRPLSADQCRELFAATADDRLAALYILAVDSGARQGEIFALEWTDWFPETRELAVTKAVSDRKGVLRIKPPKTRASRRRVVLSSRTAVALVLHRGKMTREGHNSPVMFPNVDGAYLRCSNFHRDYWQPALRAAGLPRTRFHDLRHTCATLLLQAGDSLSSIADRLGHANVEMVLKTYGHVVPKMRRESAARMDDVLR